MKIIEKLSDITKPFPNAVVTIGNFDGVHIGHQALFHSVIEKAEELGGTSVAVTFEPHPIRVLKKNGHPPLITLFRQKIELIGRSGIDALVCIRFTKQFAEISAGDFIENILVRAIGMKAIVLGEDYAFGKNREGNPAFLKKAGEKLGFHVIVSRWIRSLHGSDERISSTRIRELVQRGAVDQAQQLLGRYYQIRGVVEHGRNRGGRLLGFPTANLQLQDELCPQKGVYAVTVELGGRLYSGVANIGYSPTFEDQQFTVEVHILDFHEDIYGEAIRINFIHRIRHEIRFARIDDLKEQINADIHAARELIPR